MKQWLALILLGSLLLTGCTSFSNSSSHRVEYGTITEMTLHQPEKSSGSVNLGMIIGGTAGAIIGYQFGGGAGKVALSAVGAVGGAIIGNTIQKATEKDRLEIYVSLDSGVELIVTQAPEGELHIGDRVRVVNDRVQRARNGHHQ